MTNPLHATVRAYLATFAEITENPGPEPWPLEEILRRAAAAEGLLAFMTDHVDAAFLEACPALRVIACALKGTDNFDLRACRARGVAVSFVPDLLTAPTAELTVGLMIALGRHLLEGDALVRSGGFAGWRPALYGAGLDGAEVGILGMGAIGQAIAQRLRGFGCRIAYADQCRPDAAREAEFGIVFSDADAIIARSDWLILALPLTPQTRHRIDRTALRRMRPGAMLINPARGSLVEEAAVAEALENGTLGGYAADVFEMEDWALATRPRSIDTRLLAHPRTLFTPHLGSAVGRVRQAIEMHAAEDLAAFFAGRPMPGAMKAVP
ncbi:NAD(P)-dependent oxidoreductase [Rhodovarius lipocyclicus]|nr:NAD(P)-dependent oxidoreductase [Rhodovarius lipocyclicus]